MRGSTIWMPFFLTAVMLIGSGPSHAKGPKGGKGLKGGGSFFQGSKGHGASKQGGSWRGGGPAKNAQHGGKIAPGKSQKYKPMRGTEGYGSKPHYAHRRRHYYNYPFYLGLNFIPWLYGHSYYAPGYYSEAYFYDYSVSPYVAGIYDPADQETAAQPADDGMRYWRSAEDGFRAGEYEEAVRLAKHALVEIPDDGQLHEFTSQALFAIGEYRAAAAALHQAAALQQPDNWGWVTSNYDRYYRGREYV